MPRMTSVIRGPIAAPAGVDALQQLVHIKLARLNALQRRDPAHQDMITPSVSTGLLHRHHVRRLLDHQHRAVITPRVGHDGARV